MYKEKERGEPVEDRQPLIHTRITKLVEQIALLEEVTADLCSRLQLVLREEPPATCIDKDATKADPVPVARELNDMYCRLAHVTIQLQDVLARCEI